MYIVGKKEKGRKGQFRHGGAIPSWRGDSVGETRKLSGLLGQLINASSHGSAHHSLSGLHEGLKVGVQVGVSV